MPISQFTQPAQGTYQQSYVQPPIEQLGQIGQTMQKQQAQQRQAAQELVSNLQGLGLGGGDVPRAEEKIGQVKQAVNQLAEEQGYDLRSPEFKSKFQNLRTSVRSDPFWSIAPQKKEEAQQVRERLQDYGHNLPSSVVNRAREQLDLYEKFGSVDPRTGRPIQFDPVPEEVQDPSDKINEMIGEPKSETVGDFGEGVTRARAASLAGLTWDPEGGEEGQGVYTLEGGIPAEFKNSSAGRELTRQAQHMAMTRAANEGRDTVSQEEVSEIERGLYKRYAARQAEQESGIEFDYNAYSQAMEMRQGQTMDPGTRQTSMEFWKRVALDETSTFDKEPLREWLDMEDGKINPNDFTRRVERSQDGEAIIDESSPIVIDPAMGWNPEQMKENMDQVTEWNKLQQADNTVTEDLSSIEEFEQRVKQSAQNLATQFGYPSGQGVDLEDIDVEGTNAYSRMKEAYRQATGVSLDKIYPNASSKVFETDENGNPTNQAKEAFNSIRTDISEGIKNREKQFPEDIEDRSNKMEAAEGIGNQIGNLPGSYEFEPFGRINKINTESGEVYIGGNLVIEKSKAEKILEEEGKSIKGLKDAGALEVVPGTKDGNAYVRLKTYLKAPMDTKTLTDTYAVDYGKMHKGSLGEKYTQVQNLMGELKTRGQEAVASREERPQREDILNNQ